MCKGFEGRFEDAVEFLERNAAGEVLDALYHPRLGAIGLPYGKVNKGKKKGYGLKHIIDDHSREELEMVPEILATGTIFIERNRAIVETGNHEAIIRLDYDDKKGNWLLSAYEIRHPEGTEQRARRHDRLLGRPGGFPTGPQEKGDSTIPESRGPLQSDSDTRTTPDVPSATTDEGTDTGGIYAYDAYLPACAVRYRRHHPPN
ncbi:MAG: hypothetical protein ACC655_02065, partial [Rhodothermia bacterium]